MRNTIASDRVNTGCASSDSLRLERRTVETSADGSGSRLFDIIQNFAGFAAGFVKSALEEVALWGITIIQVRIPEICLAAATGVPMSLRQLSRSRDVAFILQDGASISHSELADLVYSFRQRFSGGRGLLQLRCDGSFRQYVAYFAALAEGIPVLLTDDSARWEDSSFSIRYSYLPGMDDFRDKGEEKSARIHPDTAVLLSTSGSTGSAKCVRLSHQNIESNAASIAQYLCLNGSERAAMALPFNYSFGMSIINSHLLVQGSISLTDLSVTDTGFWGEFAARKCTSFSGVPHCYELMERAQVRTSDLGSLRYMAQAGGKLGAERVARWARRGASEGWKFLVMYGQTEASPRMAYLPPENAAAYPECIGVPVPGGKLRIVGEDGASLEPGMQGELAYSGPNVMMGYGVCDRDLAQGHTIRELLTGDIAVQHPGGLFEIVGRKSRFVKPFGLRISLDAVEDRLRSQGRDVACSARGDRLVVLIAQARQESAISATAVQEELAKWLGVPATSMDVHLVHEIPRSASGKVDGEAVRRICKLLEHPVRNELKTGLSVATTWLTRRLGLGKGASVTRIFEEHFRLRSVDPEATFEALGGDSLSYISVSMELEKHINRLPSKWHLMTVASLESLAGSRAVFAGIDTPTFVRFLAIVLIVSGHLGLSASEDSTRAYALIFVAGWMFATFTAPAILSTGSIRAALNLLTRIWVMTFLVGAATYLATGYGSLAAMLLVSNWISPKVEGGLWFIDVYVQISLGIVVLASAVKVREAIANSAFTAYVLAATLALLAYQLLYSPADDILFRRLPHLLCWMFLLGMAAACATRDWQRTAVSTVLLAGCGVFFGWQLHFFLAATLAMIWLPVIPFPTSLVRPVRLIAGASLMIYLTHFLFSGLVDRTFGDHALAEVVVAIAGGVIAWQVYVPVDNWISARLNQARTQAGRRASQAAPRLFNAPRARPR